MNEGEAKFVEDLSQYLDIKQPKNEIYLLRNLTRSKGVGFYEAHSFYPDFIMWIKKNGKQIIVFIDPKGLTHLGLDDPKLQLHKYLTDQVQKELHNPNVKLDAFIISVTPYSFVSKMSRDRSLAIEDYEKNKHLLFQYRDEGVPNPTYVEKLFEIVTMEA